MMGRCFITRRAGNEVISGTVSASSKQSLTISDLANKSNFVLAKYELAEKAFSYIYTSVVSLNGSVNYSITTNTFWAGETGAGLSFNKATGTFTGAGSVYFDGAYFYIAW